MDSAPAVTSAGALFLSTPLLAAAQLWAWHPLWAAGIWTAYGIGALVPHGEAWLEPLTEAPFYARNKSLHPGRSSSDPMSIIIKNDQHNETTSITSPTSTLSGQVTVENVSPSTTVNYELIAKDHDYNGLYDNQENPTSSNDALGSSTSILSDQSAATYVRPSPAAYDKLIMEDHAASQETYDLSFKTWMLLAVCWALIAAPIIVVAWPWIRLVPRLVRYLGSVMQVINAGAVGSAAWHWMKVVPQLVRHLFLGTQVTDEGVNHDTWVSRQWLANLIWGGQTTRARLIRALTFFLVCLILASYVCQQLSILIVSLATAIYHAIVAVVKGGKVAGDIVVDPLKDLNFGSSYNRGTRTSVSTNTVNTVFTCLSELKHCTTAANNNRLYPDGSYNPASMLSSRTGNLCAWIESFVMHLRFIPLLVRTSLATALKYCYTVAWIEWLMIHYHDLAQAIAPAVEVAEPMIDFVRRLIGCAPFFSMISGSMCSIWAHRINRMLCVALLTTFCALNFLTAMRWPAPQPRTVAGVLKSTIAVLLMIIVPFAAFAWYLWLTQTSIEAEWKTVALTILFLWYSLDWLEAK